MLKRLVVTMANAIIGRQVHGRGGSPDQPSPLRPLMATRFGSDPPLPMRLHGFSQCPPNDVQGARNKAPLSRIQAPRDGRPPKSGAVLVDALPNVATMRILATPLAARTIYCEVVSPFRADSHLWTGWLTGRSPLRPRSASRGRRRNAAETAPRPIHRCALRSLCIAKRAIQAIVGEYNQ